MHNFAHFIVVFISGYNCTLINYCDDKAHTTTNKQPNIAPHTTPAGVLKGQLRFSTTALDSKCTSCGKAG